MLTPEGCYIVNSHCIQRVALDWQCRTFVAGESGHYTDRREWLVMHERAPLSDQGTKSCFDRHIASCSHRILGLLCI